MPSNAFTLVCLLFQQQATSQTTLSKLPCSYHGLRESTVLDTLYFFMEGAAKFPA
jgi:hypothetical protein